VDQQFIGFVVDLSAQKKAESESHAGEEKFRLLAESIPQMIFTTDVNGIKTYCSSRYLEYAGCSSVSEINDAWTDLIHPDDRSRVEASWRQSLLTKVPYDVEYRMRRQDGAYRHHVARAVPTRDQDGVINGWVGSITDIHDTKQAEELLRRTEKLSAAARIAASLAHEVNNPLASVTNTLYLALQDQDISPTTRQYLRLADQELRRVAQVTTQTLRFHKQSSPARSADLAALMESSLSTYSRRLQASETQVIRDFKPGLFLFCLADEMLQAFGHLLSNSIDALGTGGRLQIRIARARRWDASMMTGIKVTIADNGKGIPKHFLPRIFEAFSSTKDPTGTGLGMWLVDGVVRKHDGRIAIRTSTGRRHGTVISLFFPYIGVTEVIA
jgi:PAS domain S-box-containing protein